MSDQFLNFAKFLDIKRFAEESILNDNANSNGILRINRFIAILNIPKSVRGKNNASGFGQGNNNDLVENGGNDTLSWNCFKINCPAFRLEFESKEVNMIPRHYAKNWAYDDLEISYLETSDFKIRHFFFEWMHGLLDVETFERRYYDDIKSDWFVIYPLNGRGQVERFDIFRDLVPFDINSINFDVSDDGTSINLTTIKFKYYKHEILSMPPNESGQGSTVGEFDRSDPNFSRIMGVN